jgi:hypothetical protein
MRGDPATGSPFVFLGHVISDSSIGEDHVGTHYAA